MHLSVPTTKAFPMTKTRRSLRTRMAAVSLAAALAVTVLGIAPVAAAITTYSGVVDFDAGKKWQTHTLPVGESGTLTATLSWATPANLDLGLQRLDGTTWVGVKWVTSSTANPEVLTADIDGTQTYRLAVAAKSGGTTEYGLTAETGTTTEPAPSGDGTFTGWVDYSAGTKFRTHDLPVSEVSTLTVSLDWDTDANLDLGLQKFQDGKWVGVKWTSSTTAKPESFSASVDPANTYRLAVVAKSGGRTNYTATATFGQAASDTVATFSTAFGFRGHAGIYPYGMEWNEHNNTILVADIWNHAVKPFTTGGSPTGGTTFVGSGTLTDRVEPFDVEADPRNGDVWVANEAYSRVDRFRADGTRITAIGKASGSYGQGCGGGKVYWPTNVALHTATNRLYISDGYCGTVSAYSLDGTYLSSISFDLSHLSSYGKPTVRGIDVDAAGNVWLAEHKSRTLMKFAPDGGKPLMATPRIERMFDPRGIAVDRSGGAGHGMVYVVGGFWNEVYRFAPDGSYLGKWEKSGTAASDPAFDAIRYVAVDGSGDVYVGDTWEYRVFKLAGCGLTVNCKGSAMSWSQAPLPPPNGGFNQMSGIGLDAGSGLDSQKLFAADYFEQRVQWFDTHSATTTRSCSASNCDSWLGEFGSRTPNIPNSAGIAYPRSMTVAGGSAWVDGGQSLVRYDTNGNWISRYGKWGNGPNEFKGGPTGVRVIGTATSGRIYTTDTGNCRIQITDYTGDTNATSVYTHVAHMGSCGTDSSQGQMGLPQQIDVDESRNLAYVADGAAGRHKIHVWNLSTKTMKSFGATVDGVGLNRPRGVVLDPARQWLYVSDSSNRRVVRIKLGADGYPTTTAELVTRGGDTGDGFLQLGQPRALEFGPRDGKLYIGDFNQRVYAYTINR